MREDGKKREKILVTSPSIPELDEYVDEIRAIWETKWLTNAGAKHEKLQEELCRYLEADNVKLLVNGHMALELSFAALGITEGEVITTPFTFSSTTHSIVRNGLTPVFCDISPKDYTIDVTKIESLITDRTAAILPVHVYGNICDVDAIQDIADRHGLKVIYDAAHTFGETYKGAGVAGFGNISCFSFHATKVFNTIEGGAVACRDRDVAEKILLLRDFGIRTETDVDMVGTNGKMNEFCAAMGLCNLRHVDDEIAKRGKLVSLYRKRLSDVRGIRLNPVQDGVKSNHAYFPILVEEEYGKDRDELADILKENGIYARKYFYPLTNAYGCYKGIYDPEDTPVALDISRKVLTLPLYADLGADEVERICEVIRHK